MANWTDADVAELTAAYGRAQFKQDLDLDGLARRIGRHKSNICRKARELGLTGKLRSNGIRKERRIFRTAEELSAHRSETQRVRLATRGHPRGMAGKVHSEKTKDAIRQKSLAYRSSITVAEAREIAGKAMQTTVARYGRIAPNVSRGNWKAGWREIGGKRNFYRSRWEANYARYLEWLKQRGEITDWQHEPETFWFDNIKRGVRSYLPDFRAWENDGTTALHEVKGWMDARSKTTLKRMAKYHPQERIIVIREKDYNDIARKIGPMIEGWESGGRADRP